MTPRDRWANRYRLSRVSSAAPNLPFSVGLPLQLRCGARRVMLALFTPTTMPKTEPAKPSQVKHLQQRAEQPAQDKGQKFEPFYIAAVGRGACSLARELRLDRKR